MTKWSSGYSGGSGSTGLEDASAPNDELLNDSTPDGPMTLRSVIRPSFQMVHLIPTCPPGNNAAGGISQWRWSVALNRRSHDPKSTPLVSNWNVFEKFWPKSPSRLTY